LRSGPGGVVSLGVPRWCSAMCRGSCPSLVTTSLMAVRVGNDSCGMPVNPPSHLSFSMAGEVCRRAAWPLALGTVTVLRACAARHSARARTA
jgi:hypothetical protein